MIFHAPSHIGDIANQALCSIVPAWPGLRAITTDAFAAVPLLSRSDCDFSTPQEQPPKTLQPLLSSHDQTLTRVANAGTRISTPNPAR